MNVDKANKNLDLASEVTYNVNGRPYGGELKAQILTLCQSTEKDKSEVYTLITQARVTKDEFIYAIPEKTQYENTKQGNISNEKKQIREQTKEAMFDNPVISTDNGPCIRVASSTNPNVSYMKSVDGAYGIRLERVVDPETGELTGQVKVIRGTFNQGAVTENTFSYEDMISLNEAKEIEETLANLPEKTVEKQQLVDELDKSKGVTTKKVDMEEHSL